MNNSTKEHDQNEKRLKKIGGSLIMVLVLSACIYFLPSHPIVVAAVILGFFLSIWRDREAKQVFDLLDSFSEWAISTSYQALVKIFRCVRRILQAIRIFPRTTSEKEE